MNANTTDISRIHPVFNMTINESVDVYHGIPYKENINCTGATNICQIECKDRGSCNLGTVYVAQLNIDNVVIHCIHP